MCPWIALAATLTLAAGCGDGAPADPVADVPTIPPDAGEVAEPADLPPVDPFDTAMVTLTGDDQRHDMPVYVANTSSLRQQGLMGWEALPDGAGMLFEFGDERRGGFWMKDTLIPLSIAFADTDGEILAILDMEPCEEDPCPSYDPDVAYRHALEVDQGRFDELGVEPGWSLEVH